MSQQTKTILAVVVFMPVWFLVYAFFHEASHAVLHLAYGGTIERFVFWTLSPHVSATGTEFTPFAAALNRVAGELFTRLLGVVAIAFYRKEAKAPAYHLCYFFALLSLTGGVLVAWVFLPFYSLFGVVQPQDITFFLDMTGFHPLLVSLTGLLLISAFVLFAHSRGIIVNVKTAYYTLLQKDYAPRFNGKWGIVALGLVLAAAIPFAAAFHVTYEPPSIFTASASVADVRTRPYAEYTFIADGARNHRFDLEIQGQDFMTGFIIEDAQGNLQFSWAVEETSTSFGLGLSEGMYTIRFLFLTDFAAVRDFLIEIDVYAHVDAEAMQGFRDVFAHPSDYSIAYALRVR
ncbi:MAG: hypothetical protein FWB88_08530 [Defluviitaleaceae bacterium]|nr:hypothetical protein [Defluviitaleaceae bacterium]MCL2240723.1 hypothetical protein [Defluviitaleaceae bacterium]